MIREGGVIRTDGGGRANKNTKQAAALLKKIPDSAREFDEAVTPLVISLMDGEKGECYSSIFRGIHRTFFRIDPVNHNNSNRSMRRTPCGRS